MNNDIRLSIILPVYNVSDYLRQCVESLLYGIAPDTEIIIVDDGSTDSSPEICDEYANRYAFVRVLHQLNAGLSAARNAGLSAARGLYISFIDSDDMASSIVMNKMIDLLDETKADYVISNFMKIPYYSSEKYYEHPILIKNYEILNQDAIICDINKYSLMVWNKVYRREIIEGVKFPVGAIYEDVYFMTELIKRAKNVVVTDGVLNYYRIHRPGSTFASSFSDSRYKGFQFMERFITVCSDMLSPSAFQSACQYASDFFQLQYYEAVCQNKNDVCKDMLKRYKKYIHYVPFQIFPLYRSMFRLMPYIYVHLKIKKNKLCSYLRK